jgi:molybdenum cofactor cytidylyltransferase
MRALGAIVLAAGSSERFGADNKLLADIGGNALIRVVVGAVVGAGIADVVVVTGSEEERIAAALDALPLRFAHNANWRAGMGMSIAAGIAALRTQSEGAFVVPGDMPRLTSDLFMRVAAAFDGSGRRAIVFPADAAGEQRNPVLWPKRFFPELTTLSGPKGAKALLQAHSSECLAVLVEDPAILEDIDTQDDLQGVRSSPTV